MTQPRGDSSAGTASAGSGLASRSRADSDLSSPFPTKPANVRRFHSRGLSFTQYDASGVPSVFFSTLEWETHLAVRWRQPDARVQTQEWLTPAAEVDEIADELGIRRPRKSPRVPTLSTDLVVTTAKRVMPIACKYSAELDQTRVQEKLQIAARYWERRGHVHEVRTERDLPRPFVRNLRQAYFAATAFDSWPLEERRRLLGCLRDASCSARMQTAGQLTANVATRLRTSQAKAMTVFWAALWHRWLPADLARRIMPMSVLGEFVTSL